jgi:flagellar biosynthetic protein FlhB
VAQVLAYVMQLKAALSGQGRMPGNLPDLDVPQELDPLHGQAARDRVLADAANASEGLEA